MLEHPGTANQSPIVRKRARQTVQSEFDTRGNHEASGRRWPGKERRRGVRGRLLLIFHYKGRRNRLQEKLQWNEQDRKLLIRNLLTVNHQSSAENKSSGQQEQMSRENEHCGCAQEVRQTPERKIYSQQAKVNQK